MEMNEGPVKLFSYKKPKELFAESDLVKICAPMVRYTKLPFRQLVRKYGCDLVYTPMIMADSFVRSEKARDVEFTTNEIDRPLIVQFAANNVSDFVNATRFVRNYSDGVNLNCGCPQRWAIQEGVGSAMIDKAELVCEMIKETRKAIDYDKDYSISIKIRIHDDIKKTVDLVRKIEAAGANYLTVHARTRYERHQPVHLDALELLASTCSDQMPLVANGDLFSWKDCLDIKQKIPRLRGVMCARGLLENPALFAGYESTPIECVRDFLQICLNQGSEFPYIHKCLAQMLYHLLSKSERRLFTCLQSTAAVIDYLDEFVFKSFEKTG